MAVWKGDGAMDSFLTLHRVTGCRAFIVCSRLGNPYEKRDRVFLKKENPKMEQNANKPEAWLGTGAALFGKDKRPYPTRDQGLATLGMVFLGATRRDRVNHLIGDDPERYGISKDEMTRIVDNKKKYDQQIGMNLEKLTTVDGRKIKYRTTRGTQYDKESGAGDIKNIIERVLSKYDGLENFAQKKENLVGQLLWEIMAIVDGGDLKVGWEIKKLTDYYWNTPMATLISDPNPKWNEVPYYRLLREVIDEINPNIKTELITVDGEPDMATNGSKTPPYSSLPSQVCPTMGEDYDTCLQKHSHISRGKLNHGIDYYGDYIVEPFEKLFGALENDRIYQVQKLIASNPSKDNQTKLKRLLIIEKTTEVQRILTPRASLDINLRGEIKI